MVTLPLTFTPSSRVFVPAATKSTVASSTEEKGFLDWLLGALVKEDQLLEVDPILKKVEGKSGGTTGTTGTKKGTVEVPQKKKNGGGFGGLFAKQ
uniref:Thylakoid soluble phosphoprotein TSP9 n=1 Tax=Kalanchoe fedtschenkoi TaxID=63787 RepID=A0A7N0U3R8_KALFE